MKKWPDEQPLEVIDLPTSFTPRVSENTFASVVFVNPLSKKWPFVWNFCKNTIHLQDGKNFLALFSSTPESIRILGNVLHEVYTWKTAYLFIYGKLITNKSNVAQWMQCYLKSFDHDDPRRTYCLKENYYYHFRNQLAKTAKENQTVSFITPCICAAGFARFSDQLPSSFKEQFDYFAKVRFAHLCPNYNLENFQGPFIREGSPFNITIGIKIDIDSEDIKEDQVMALINCSECGKEISDKASACPNCGNPISAQTTPDQETVVRQVHEQAKKPQGKPTKKKTGCLTWIAAICLGFVLLLVIGVIAGKKDNESTLHSITSKATQETNPAINTSDLPRLTAIQLQKEYEANEVAANQKYKRQQLIVTGTVDSIDETITGAPVLMLKGTSSFNWVIAGLKRNPKDAAGQLNKGARVTLRCTVTGFVVGSTALDDCTFVE